MMHDAAKCRVVGCNFVRRAMTKARPQSVGRSTRRKNGKLNYAIDNANIKTSATALSKIPGTENLFPQLPRAQKGGTCNK